MLSCSGWHHSSHLLALPYVVAFKVYDIDRDGYISNGELFLVLKMMVGNNLKVCTWLGFLWLMHVFNTANTTIFRTNNFNKSLIKRLWRRTMTVMANWVLMSLRKRWRIRYAWFYFPLELVLCTSISTLLCPYQDMLACIVASAYFPVLYLSPGLSRMLTLSSLRIL